MSQWRQCVGDDAAIEIGYGEATSFTYASVSGQQSS
ncbi:hypothetical protein PF005_g13719 [Phytophthora fragariae]|uniref:Uncharacterized protein n=1 Tax=Phytophthora fragariae TaxID=53985 RepID=A0A6A3XLB6_9STRA|nr:hypothetical protein PF003_g470 [Phytophthora fragariae]KAE9025946.1 hypothetical protein PF011_g2807 [Phytophthora fragariae]KAE9139233.1 hypothetical protein PF010_g663 [Phytophthora fragariae]KAE9204634.1 hypothetical protein PF005_g13719 [Phytophthora fragariae]KAE9222602.1 hypothetical protein PF004_g12749 [Phytophthora fragariae]